MLSILIPTYNTNITLLVTEIHRQCQLLSYPFEIILLDDASTNSKVQQENKKLSQTTESSYRQNEKNLGRTGTRQKLAQLASHPWLLFLDADVEPKHRDFLERFALPERTEFDIIFGGIAYKDEKPKEEEVLRWTYGRHREAKSVSDRLKAPHFIISQNLMIKKEVFLKINSVGENKYGLDNIVSFHILKQGIKILHIENPVYHLGLETTNTFLEKSIDSLKTTIDFMNMGEVPNDFRPVQKVYLKMNKMGLTMIFCATTRPFLKHIERNLRSSRPNLTFFDVYRLYHYIVLIEQKHA